MKRNKLYLSMLCCSLAIPLSAVAQDDETVEEIVVTGSFIKREKFDMASPIETLDGIEIQQSGYTNIGDYVRDLTYTSNVDTVSNVLGAADGIQDGVSARFNLRGLGESSTLTLYDGRRVVDDGAVGSIMPDIMMQRAEVILDGGAATYGTDAVAGVVNLIPIKEFDGFKLRGFYTKDGEWTSHENKISGLFGKTGEQWKFVAGLEYSERPDPIYRADRPEYLRADNDTSTTGNAGSYTGLPHLPSGVQVGVGLGPQVGTLPPPSPPLPIFLGFEVDPGCGTNNPNTDDGTVGAYPSGIPAIDVAGAPAVCTFEYGAYQDYKRAYKDTVFATVITYDVNDSLSFELLLNYDDRESNLVASPSTGEAGSNDLLTITAAHPTNNVAMGGFGSTVAPRSWRPFSNNGATQPSHLIDYGSESSIFNNITKSYSLVSDFSFGETSWSGQAALTQARREQHISGKRLHLDRIAQALRGEGGENADQWFNPFFSASPYSANYMDCEVGTAAGCTANAQDLVDWMHVGYNYLESQWDYWSVEGFATGDIFELPAGDVQLAVGAQIRENKYANYGSGLQRTPSVEFPTAAGDGGPASVDYNTAPINGLDPGIETISKVNSVFFETLIPILDNLEMTIAARYEDFTDIGVSAGVPKVSFRYTPIDNLALRASYGEGFLAPTAFERTVVSNPDCAESFTGSDPALGGSIVGSLSCSTGNENVEPEESTVINIGATWQATDDLEISLDYQTIDYQDRIIRLSSVDRLTLDYANFLRAAGITDAQFDALTPAQQDALFLPWANGSDSDPLIERNALNGDVIQVTRVPDNVASVEIDVVDFRLSHNLDMGDFGLLRTNWSTTWYTKYDYEDAFGQTAQADGMQNGQTDIAPPIPEMKHQLRFAWLLDNHFVGLTANYQDSVEFDASIGPAFSASASYTGDTNGLGTAVAPKTIDATTIVDLRYGYTFEEAFNGRLELALGSNNIFDEKGQPLPVVGGLETRLQDPTGRTYYMEATYTFE